MIGGFDREDDVLGDDCVYIYGKACNNQSLELAYHDLRIRQSLRAVEKPIGNEVASVGVDMT